MLAAGAGEAFAGVDKGDRAPELSGLRDAAGKAVSLRALRGKVVVVTFGASWCAPCKKELPVLDALAKRYTRGKVAFIAVNIDSDKAKGQRFMHGLGIGHMRAAYDPQKRAVRIYDPPAMPTIFVIGKHGIVREIHKGYRSGDEKSIAKVISSLL
ncbi:MAG TPA: TlpA disulfide reductase family protein [Kofleriaceae bacterium]|nr:TlpA disulfide reductase family protein [Kofleriaceae bacterium]